jgi:hypothetical protein
MAKLIKNLRDNRQVVFDNGSFDAWCVYVVEANRHKSAPLDTTYFAELQEISRHYEDDKVYNDFVRIYELTNGSIDPTVLSLIDEIVDTYNEEDKIIIEQWFAVIYGGMIAEENKQNAILKKRIKRLGMYQSLILNMPAREAANFSKGKKAIELSPLMQGYGF